MREHLAGIGNRMTTPLPVAGPSQLRGPNIGRLCLMESGTRVRVTGRAWDLFDDIDLIEVTIETKDGHFTKEEMSIALFDALMSGAKVVL